MTIENLIEKLQKIQEKMPGARVKYGDILGPDISPIIDCFKCEEDSRVNVVCIADVRSDIAIRFMNYNNLMKIGVTEEHFYKELLKNFTLEEIERYAPKDYKKVKEYCEKNKMNEF